MVTILNTTPALQPSPETCSTKYYYPHPKMEKAAGYIQAIYMMKPALRYIRTALQKADTRIQNLTVTSLLKIKTGTLDESEQKLQTIHQQLQQLQSGNVQPKNILNTKVILEQRRCRFVPKSRKRSEKRKLYRPYSDR